MWKIANVTIMNKPGRKLRSNYRLFSINSIICKIFESFLKKVMKSHLKAHTLIILYNQHHFVSSKACVFNLLECQDITTNAFLDRLDLKPSIVNWWRHLTKLHTGSCYTSKSLVSWVSVFLIGRKRSSIIGSSGLSWILHHLFRTFT